MRSTVSCILAVHAKILIGPGIGGVIADDAVSTWVAAGDDSGAKVLGGPYMSVDVEVTTVVGVDWSGMLLGTVTAIGGELVGGHQNYG